jgi:hypothetical protein
MVIRTVQERFETADDFELRLRLPDARVTELSSEQVSGGGFSVSE